MTSADHALPPMLTTAMMDELWEALRSVGAPVVDHARPGLTEEQVHQLMAPTYLHPPQEVVVWWTYHNGTDLSAGPKRYISPSKDLISLEEALSLRESMELVNWRMARQSRLDDVPWDDMWRDGWLPLIVRDRPMIVCDCSREYRRTTPLRRSEIGDLAAEQTYEVRAPSIGTMVQLWIGAIRDGLWTINPETGSWQRDWDAMSLHWKLTGFM